MDHTSPSHVDTMNISNSPEKKNTHLHATDSLSPCSDVGKYRSLRTGSSGSGDPNQSPKPESPRFFSETENVSFS